MSYEDGWAAIHLEMPPRVPHTEYSIERHWGVIKALTGMDISPSDPEYRKSAASRALIKALNLDFLWNTYIGGKIFSSYHTDMGHAEYEAGGVDRRDSVFCPFTMPEEVLSFDFGETYGSVNPIQARREFEEDFRERSELYPDLVNMTGIYVTLVSGLIEIFGWEMLLLAAGSDPVSFGKVANRYTDWIAQYFQALAEANVPVVMIHDDMVWTSGPIFSPKWYREYIFPNYRRLFAPLRESGKKIIFTSDGDYTLFIDDIAACGVHGFVLEPGTDMAYLAENYGKSHVFIGNADTRILLNGSRENIRREVERCMCIGKDYPGYFLAVGNHIPANTPVENVLYYLELYEALSKR